MVSHYERSTELEGEFDVLIILMADMITAQARAGYVNVNAPVWSVDLHNLLKLFKHLCSARALLEPCGFRTPTLPPYGYIDHSSVMVVTRSAIENYLVMHWLHANGDAAKQNGKPRIGLPSDHQILSSPHKLHLPSPALIRYPIILSARTELRSLDRP